VKMMRSRKPMTSGKRAVEVREPKTTDTLCIVFSFKYLVDVDDVGQSLKAWAAANEKLLLGLLLKMQHISQQTPAQAQQDSAFTIYGNFPAKKVCDFTCPPQLADVANWGVIRDIAGQKGRVAGFLKENVFYIVYLDKDHRFWKSDRR